MRVRLSLAFPAIYFLFLFSASTVFSQTTEFNYQGSLKDGANAANGNYDLEFALFDLGAGGSQKGAALQRNSVVVSNGNFAVSLDFGDQFPGADRYLEIRVRPAGGGGYTTLSPRVKLNSSPYAIRALTVTGPITGIDPTATLSVSNSQPGITNPSPINLPPAALRAEATSTSDSNVGLVGIGDGTTGLGVVGISNGIAPVGGGGNAAGVIGIATATSGKSFGISGQVNSPDGIAVQGNSSNGGRLFVGSNDMTGDVFTVNSSGSVIARSFTNADQSFVADQLGNLRVNAINAGPPGGNNDTFVVQPDGTVNTHNLFATGNLNATGNVNAVGLTLTGNETAVQLNVQGITVSGPISASGNTQTGSLTVTTSSTLHDLTTSSTAQVHDLNILSLPGGGSVTLCINGVVVSTCSSSLRYKTNIGSFSPGLGLIRRLHPITFDWKQGGMHDLGLGAEDVAAVEPLLVTYNDKGQVEGVKYDRVGVVAINAIKEQQAQIESQAKQVEAMEKQNQTLEKLIERQEAANKRQQAEIDALKRLVCSTKKNAAACR